MDVEPRPLEVASEEVRAAQAAATGGQPNLAFSGESTPYIDYQSIDVLLSLQHPRSPSHDEMTFYISGQVMELLFKLALNEVHAAQVHIDSDNFGAATKLLRRVVRIEELLLAMWPVLGTLTPNDFNSFRDYLGTSSGFQSYMYRALEFALGNKVEAMLQPHMGVPSVFPELKRTFDAPSLWDSVAHALARHGHDISDAYLNRDVTAAYENDQSLEQAWLKIYRANDREDTFFQLGEALMDVADGFTTWRMKHFVTVERIIGFKIGTGGTTGIQWLKSVIDHRFFPELWAIRTLLP
jgi:tryptophan 2,3-dioxygenase